MRLIDADGLMEHACRDKLDSRELIAKMIENAPTVKEIPIKIPMYIFERLLTLTESKTDRCCGDCAYWEREEWEEPCKRCKRNCKDYWRKSENKAESEGQ